jgi:hypothetical protein
LFCAGNQRIAGPRPERFGSAVTFSGRIFIAAPALLGSMALQHHLPAHEPASAGTVLRIG